MFSFHFLVRWIVLVISLIKRIMCEFWLQVGNNREGVRTSGRAGVEEGRAESVTGVRGCCMEGMNLWFEFFRWNDFQSLC